MIVRDEAAMLPRFLQHARGLWDELSVVDTGSIDETPTLLAAAGAKVLHRPWTGDFAAARNVSLEAATGDWILVLDPDELVSPDFVASARSVIEDETAGSATVLMRNRLPHGHVHEARLLRMFRRDPEIRFCHAIHEDVTEAVRHFLTRSGLRQVHLAGSIDHLGYVRAHAAAKEKKTRDVTCLERLIEADPADLYAHYKRLEQARFWGDGALWRAAAADAITAMQANRDRLAQGHFGGELVSLVADGLYRGEPRRALALMETWSMAVAPSAAFFLRRGELHELVGQLDEAGADFDRCRGLAGVTQSAQLATVRPLLGLVRVALARGDVQLALARVAEALEFAPRDPEALLAAVTLHRALGGRPAVEAFAEEHVAAYGPGVELDEAVGEGALLAGDLALGLEALGRARAAVPLGGAALRLAVAQLASGAIS